MERKLQKEVERKKKEEEELIRQNKQLSETVGKLEAQVNQQMKLFQDTLSSAKTRYVAEIEKVVKSSEQGKKQAEAKVTIFFDEDGEIEGTN